MSCPHYIYCLCETDRHYVDCEKENNCVLCVVANEGPLTQEETGKYLNISKLRVSQIERKAIEKMRKINYDQN